MKRYLTRRRRQNVRAMTLLELLLALSLMVIVMMTIGMAIDLHFKLLDLRRTNVEEAVEVRSMFNVIGKDLIGVMQYTPPDTSGIDLMASNLTGAAQSALASGDPTQVANLVASATGGAGGTGGGAGTGGGGQQGTGGGTGAAPTGSQTGGQTSQTGAASKTGSTSKTGAASSGGGTTIGGAIASAASSATGAAATSAAGGEAAATTTPASVVGLYGSATELKLDVSRLPRLDQYDAMYSATGDTTEMPTDVKTIVYFLASEDTPLDPRAAPGTQEVLPSVTGTGKGLMRRELGRAMHAYAEANGDTSSLYYGARVVSDRVVGLEFQYFDGTSWLTDWDSDASGGLPKAVEIKLTIQNTYGMTEEEISRLDTTTLPAPKVYRQVVKIPTSNPAPAATEETTDTGTTGTASGAASGAASAQGTMP